MLEQLADVATDLRNRSLKHPDEHYKRHSASVRDAMKEMTRLSKKLEKIHDFTAGDMRLR